MKCAAVFYKSVSMLLSFLVQMGHYDLFRGTLAPLLRASESPIAIACLRLLTLPPLPPLPERSFPCFARLTARSTLLLAALPYLAMASPLLRFRQSPAARQLSACDCRGEINATVPLNNKTAAGRYTRKQVGAGNESLYQ
jgi:hypothetical protein